MRNNPRENLLNLHRDHVRAWEARNIDLLRELYAENAIIFHTEPPSKFNGFKTFENNLIQYFSDLKEFSFFTSNIQIEVCEPMAWVSSLYLRAYRLNDQLVRESGRWTEVYAQDESNGWKLVHLHASPDPGSGPTS